MSIVSENEMREFFQRLIDSVAELSTQASKVEGLTNQVNSLNDRLNNLEQANRELSAQNSNLEANVHRLDSEIVSTKGLLDNERAVNASLRETIVARDAGVVALETSFRQEQDSHKITTSERDDARTKISELEQSLEAARNETVRLTDDRNTWRNLATDHERELNQVKEQLGKVQSILNPLRVVSSDVA
jgi:chromosome segregation ATPase